MLESAARGRIPREFGEANLHTFEKGNVAITFISFLEKNSIAILNKSLSIREKNLSRLTCRGLTSSALAFENPISPSLIKALMKILDDETGPVKFEARTSLFHRLPARDCHPASSTPHRSLLSGPEKDGWMIVKRGSGTTRDEEHVYVYTGCSLENVLCARQDVLDFVFRISSRETSNNFNTPCES